MWDLGDTKHLKWKYGVVLRVFTAFVVIFQVFLIVYNANWLLSGDDHDFLRHPVSGDPFEAGDSFFLGRFAPLAFLEYNAFIPFGNNPSVYYLWCAFKFLVTMIFFYLVQKELLKLNSENKDNANPALIPTLLFAFMPGVYLVFLDVMYYENTIIPLSLILIYTLFRIHTRPKVILLFFFVVVFNTIIYLKESTVIFYLAILVGVTLILLTKKQNPWHRRVLLSAYTSFAVYFLFYYSISFRNTSEYYFDVIDKCSFQESIGMLGQNPLFVFALVFGLLVVLSGRSNFKTTVVVLGATIALCSFFLFTGMGMDDYRMCITYPILFVAIQREFILIISNLRKRIKAVLIIFLCFAFSYNSILLFNDTEQVIYSRSNHQHVLRTVANSCIDYQCKLYILKKPGWSSRSGPLSIHLKHVLRKQGFQKTPKEIVPIESLDEMPVHDQVVLFTPETKESLRSSLVGQWELCRFMHINNFDYAAVILKKL